MRGGFPPVPETGADEAAHRRALAAAVNAVQAGKLNVTLTVTLRPGETTTPVRDARIGARSHLSWSPATASAAAAAAGLYADTFLPGSCVLHHAATPAADRTFTIAVLG